MTVSELIDFLKTQPQHLPVAYAIYSEYCLLQAADIQVKKLGSARADGWVPYVRPNTGSVEYIVFPGN